MSVKVAKLRALPDGRLQVRARPDLERVGPARFRALVDELSVDHRLHDAVWYVLTSRGKQLRAGICLEAATYGPAPRCEEVWDAAVALELIQAASLAHDDIVDRGEVRRGRPALAERSGTVVAGVAASWMVAKAFVLVAQAGETPMRVLIDEMRALVEGQLMDAQDVFDVERTTHRYLATIERKTASLFRAALALGAISAGASEEVVHGLSRFGHHLGVLYQMSDDILDLAGREDVLGKPPGADLNDGVYTLALLYAVEEDPTLQALLPQAVGDPRIVTHILRTVWESNALQRAFAECHAQYTLAASALETASPRNHAAEEHLMSVLDYALERVRPVA